ncbi:hypothetical protein GQR58_014157 [Nymphon striatum]|nr:hypothetical protein GQR58_014157 [Nymphon striatum]
MITPLWPSLLKELKATNSFESWTHGIMEQEHDIEDFSKLSTCIGNICRAINENRYDCARTACRADEAVIDRMRQRLDQFIKMNFASPTSKLWIMYLDMIGILKKFIAAERFGIWDLHIQAT